MLQWLESRLFVYGSLRSGQTNHARLKLARFLGAASTPSGRYHLTLIDDYLALIEGPGPSVQGELYEVSAELLSDLDRFEEVPLRYCRRVVALADGSYAEAYFKAYRTP
jgi:gamma-glutamylaminecyclotransferase